MELIARPLRPSPAIAAALMLTLVAALLVPFENQGVTWLQHAGDPVPAGARIIERLSVAGAVVVSGSRAPDTAIDADARLRWESLGGAADPALDAQTDSGVASTRASQAWADSDAGKHAVVALIDTGVAAVPALRDAVAGEIDFSGSGSGSGGGDGYGHGTFLASMIAGRGPVAPGVAPRAGILSLKVAGPDGSTTLGSVLSALQWLDGPGQAAGIRVAALALAVDPDTEAAQLLDRAIERLAIAPVEALIDGDHCPHLPCPAYAIVKGDRDVAAISAASILAKTARDALLMRLDVVYPDYGFAHNKGYGTPEHLAALDRHGPCAIHRRSFAPVAQTRFLF